MSELKVIGVGMWRTATYSLKLALEELTGEPCMHMSELMPRRASSANSPEAKLAHKWLDTLHVKYSPNWRDLFQGYSSTTDWPALAFWQKLVEDFPAAKVLLSSRDSESWWQSINNTVLQVIPENPQNVWEELITELFKRDFVSSKPTKKQAIDFYEKHNALVRATIPNDRLIEWHFGDDWQPLCDALKLEVPSKPFPFTNSTAEFRRGNKIG